MNTDKPTTKAIVQPENVRRKVEFDYDQAADMSWLEQDEFRQENPEDHIALQMSVYELAEGDDDWTLVDSLGGIDCLKNANDWATGTFYNVDDLPEGYLRELAAERLQGEYGAAASLRETASAPETRTDEQWEEWLGGDGSADTIIPAEKPTTQEREYKRLYLKATSERDNVKAQAAQLADACTAALSQLTEDRPEYLESDIAQLRDALAAYEAAR